MNNIDTISTYIDDSIAYTHLINFSPNDTAFKFHTHDICEIIYVMSGDVSAIIGEKTYKLKKGSIVFFRANVPHRIRIDSDKPYERHNILFNENALANGIFTKLPKEVDLINIEDKDITELFEKIDYYYTIFEKDDLKVLVTNIVEEMLFNICASPIEEFNTNEVCVHPVIKSAVFYINKHYTEDITIDEISRAVNVTKSHLHHLFTKNLEISPKKFINMKRLSKAQRLINMGEKPTAVYTKCGFTDYGTFFRNYTSYFGFSPSQREEIAERRIMI